LLSIIVPDNNTGIFKSNRKKYYTHEKAKKEKKIVTATQKKVIADNFQKSKAKFTC
jgi:hypothetical protein